MKLRVTSIKEYSPNVRKYTSVNAGGQPLAPIAPGDHLELVACPEDNGECPRQYSLLQKRGLTP